MSASPILAGGRLYITRDDGKTYVITPEKDSKVVAENQLPSEFVLATSVFEGGKSPAKRLISPPLMPVFGLVF